MDKPLSPDDEQLARAYLRDRREYFEADTWDDLRAASRRTERGWKLLNKRNGGYRKTCALLAELGENEMLTAICLDKQARDAQR